MHAFYFILFGTDQKHLHIVLSSLTIPSLFPGSSMKLLAQVLGIHTKMKKNKIYLTLKDITQNHSR